MIRFSSLRSAFAHGATLGTMLGLLALTPTYAQPPGIAPPPITPIASFAQAQPDANVILVWSGRSKFAAVLVKRGNHWYAASGLIASAFDFLTQEVRIREGAIVFVHEGVEGFTQRPRVQEMASFFALAGSFRFYSCSAFDCEQPAFRQYYDTQDRKIPYPDAPP